MSNIKCTEFVKRQTESSPFAHFSGSWEQLEKMVEANRDKSSHGDKPGSFLVPLVSEGFFSSVHKLTTESKLTSTFEPRWKGEESYIHTTVAGSKVPAKRVEIVLYTKELLGKEAPPDCEYGIVSINASPDNLKVPMDPVTMMRNFLVRPGGTKAVYTAQEFAESIEYWGQHSMVK